MPSFEHKKLIEELTALDKLPNDDGTLTDWVKAEAHIEFLEQNAFSPEVVIYASPAYSFIHSIAVPEALLDPLDTDDLMRWSFNPYMAHAASYVSGGGREGQWVERGGSTGSNTLDQGTHLIYGRDFEGWNGADSSYFELSQEYAHLEDIHWRPEERAYCRFDENGDLLPVVSITNRTADSRISLISFNRESLDAYLTASEQVLVRLFDFTLWERRNFSGWGDEEAQFFKNSDELFYRQRVNSVSGYARGVQIIRPLLPKAKVFARMEERWSGSKEKKHVEFMAHDWRYQRIIPISTDPAATTNYFEAKEGLPFELSPAFFKPEVLLKYKGDKDKYTMEERSISCRASWYLQAYDLNEAGQVSAYICYLRSLPESELLHWLSFNEAPKAPISERAWVNDFQGEWVDFIDSLEKVKYILRQWQEKDYTWWTLRDEKLMTDVTVPHTPSRDDWGESFLALTKLVHEGFVVKDIRQHFQDKGIDFDKQERSLALLEKGINAENAEEPIRLEGLRKAQEIRSKVKGHSASKEAEQLALKAIHDYETYAAHFRHICEQIADELEIVQGLFDTSTENP